MDTLLLAHKAAIIIENSRITQITGAIRITIEPTRKSTNAEKTRRTILLSYVRTQKDEPRSRFSFSVL